MFELGKESKNKHLELANIINKTQINEVYTIGRMMKLMNRKLNGKTKIHQHFEDRELLKKYLQTFDIKKSVSTCKRFAWNENGRICFNN